MLYIGIDPGASGGIAWLCPLTDEVFFKSLPKGEEKIFKLLMDYSPVKAVTAVIERISHAAFGFSKGSNAKLYGSYMSLRMALTALDIPFEAVPSATMWRKLDIRPRKKGESRSDWKKHLQKCCKEFFPDLKTTLSTCDALLIAKYCQLVNQ